MTTIEPATLSDVDALVEAWVALADDQRHHGSTIPGVPNREAAREAVGNHVMTRTLLVAREDDPSPDHPFDGIEGFVLFGPDASGFDRDRSRGFVRDLWVRQDRRGEGIGELLLQRAEAQLAAAGYDEVALQVLADNDGARRFYDRLGYETHRLELTKQLDNQEDDGSGHRLDGYLDAESDTHTN